jgi:DNA mismatch repair protein MutS2
VLNEIDLRGKIADDAIIELDQYLAHALNSAWNEVRIIHGKGTGALRGKIHAYLKKNKNIKSYRLGQYGEGDAGVTVVEI